MSLKTEAKKAFLIADLVTVRAAILETASTLPSQAHDWVFLGIWSAKDLLAHLSGWDVTNLQAVQEVLCGQLPAFYAAYDRDWTSYNARLVAQYRRDDYSEQLRFVGEAHAQLVAFLRTVPAAEFGNDRGLRFKGVKVTIDRLLGAERDDEKVHYTQIDAFAKSWSARMDSAGSYETTETSGWIAEHGKLAIK